MARNATRAAPLLLLLFVLGGLQTLPRVDRARATEPVIARYRGTLTAYGRPLDAGAAVTAHGGGQVVARASATVSGTLAVYDLRVPLDDPATPVREGATENEPLTFRLDGVPADEVETFNAGEDRLLDLHVTRMEVCLAAFEDLDRDLARDADEPWLPGVEINVLQFFVVRTYVTTGMGEPSCALHEVHATVVRAVNWPAGYDPPSGQGQPSYVIDSPEGTHTATFPFVPRGSAIDTPTSAPTEVPTGAPSATAPRTATPTPSAQLAVNTALDPGQVGDDSLSLREAMRLAVGDLLVEDLSADEREQVSGLPGAESRDRIGFDAAAFPADATVVIEIQPPIISGFSVPDPQPDSQVLDAPFASLPALSTGGDAIDGRGGRIVLTAGLGTELFDGLVINSDGNAVQGLELRDFDTAVIVTGNARGNVLGGGDPGQALTLVNNIVGLELTGPGVTETRVLGCRIGVDRTGHTGMGNATHGIRVGEGAHGNVIGAQGAGNVISANFLDGVAILGAGSDDNALVGNFIGTDASGAVPIGNGIGVVVGSGASRTRIGGGEAGEGNVIGGNVGDGLWIQSSGTRATDVRGNHIGSALDPRRPIANGGCGVLISDNAQGTVIGGPAAAAGNRIAFNVDAGIRIRGRDTLRNTVLGNSITANGGPGIDLVGGANRSLTAPIVRRPSAGSVEGLAAPSSVVQIYSDAVDEGATYEGSVVADLDGYFLFEAAAPFKGPAVTATNTDADGNTSPFGREGAMQATSTATPTATATRTGTAAAAVTATRTASATRTQVGATGTAVATPTGTPPSATPERPSTASAYLPIVYREHVLFARLRLVPSEATIQLNDEAWIEVRLDDAKGFYGVEFEISFPTDLLIVPDEDPLLPGMQIQPGSFPDPSVTFVAENNIDPVLGLITYGCTAIGVPPQEGSGVVARFRVRGRAPGAARVDFRDWALSNGVAEPLRVSVTGAVVTVLPPTTTPEPTATAAPSATRTATSAATGATPSTATPGPTFVPSATALATSTPHTPAATGTAVVTASPVATGTPVSSETPAATGTPVEQATRTATATPLPTTSTPEPWPRPTASPTPVPPATPADGCAHPLQNTGFETDLAWVRRGARLPRYVDTVVHGGVRSALLGILPGEPNALAYSTLWQAVAVPAGARTMTVAAWTYQAAEPGGGPDRQLLLVYDINPDQNTHGQRSPIARVIGERLDARAWQRRAYTFDVTAYRGRTLWLYASVLNDGVGGRAWMYMDDMDVAFCP